MGLWIYYKNNIIFNIYLPLSRVFVYPHNDITLESFRWTTLRKNDVMADLAQCQSSVNAQ